MTYKWHTMGDIQRHTPHHRIATMIKQSEAVTAILPHLREIVAAAKESSLPSEVINRLEATRPELFAAISPKTLKQYLPVITHVYEAAQTDIQTDIQGDIQTDIQPREKSNMPDIQSDIQPTGHPATYRGFTVVKGRDGYLRGSRRIGGKRLSVYFGKKWDETKASRAVDKVIGDK